MRHHGALKETVRTVFVAGGLGFLLAGTAQGADLTSYKDMPAPEKPARKQELSANVALTTDCEPGRPAAAAPVPASRR